VSSNELVVVGLEIQSIAILLGCVSAYSIWRQLKQMAMANQASVSESLASQSFEILKYLADDPQMYERFYTDAPLSAGTSGHSKLLCFAEITANFLEHIVLQKPNLPPASREAWMRYVRDHCAASRAVRDFIGEHRDWYSGAFLVYIDPVSPQCRERVTTRSRSPETSLTTRQTEEPPCSNPTVRNHEKQHSRYRELRSGIATANPASAHFANKKSVREEGPK
jgi:hypothetical protein